MYSRRAVTLIECLVVLAIIAVLVGLTTPAVQQARQRASELTCMNNLHQMDLALAQYVETNRHLPPKPLPGVVGGWSYEVLPFLELGTLRNSMQPGVAVSTASVPVIMRCPSRPAETTPGVPSSNYVLVPTRSRRNFLLFDAPVDLHAPWTSGPEMSRQDVVRSTGPHRGGFFCASGFQEGVSFVAHEE